MQVDIKIDIKEDSQNPMDIPEFIPEAAESYWDDIEIQPVKEIEKGIVETVEEGKEDFWSIYLHQLGGGLKCIADLKTKLEAKKLAKLIWNATNYRVYSKSSKLNF
ncbi:MAG: hypothetical protein K0B11_20440 [Mariniphaga sp.]|nr:hypothetical protein [Mariniphaga sp.]